MLPYGTSINAKIHLVLRRSIVASKRVTQSDEQPELGFVTSASLLSGRSGTRTGSLGIKSTSANMFRRKVRQGLPIRVLAHLSGELGIKTTELAGYAGIPVRTLARRKEQRQTFTRYESDRLARIAMLFDDAITLFDNNKEEASHWFLTAKKALDGHSPIEYADTEPGAQEVRDLIGRLEHGVFS